MKPKWINYIDVSNLILKHKEDFIKLREANEKEKYVVDTFINKELEKTQILSAILLGLLGICTLFMTFPLVKFIVTDGGFKNIGIYIIFIALFIFGDIKMFRIYKNSSSNPEISYSVMSCNVSSSITIPQEDSVDVVYVKLCDDKYYCTDIFSMDIMQIKKIKKNTKVLLAEIEDKYYIIPY